jgi:hypothetical protein
MIARKPAPELSYRLGLPLALLIAIGLTVAAEWLDNRPYRPDEWGNHVWYAVYYGFPFIVLALAGVRDGLAWSVGIALTAAMWGYLAWERSLSQGANIPLGLGLMFFPLFLAGVCLCIAGMRGRIAWAHDGDDPPDPA